MEILRLFVDSIDDGKKDCKLPCVFLSSKDEGRFSAAICLGLLSDLRQCVGQEIAAELQFKRRKNGKIYGAFLEAFTIPKSKRLL